MQTTHRLITNTHVRPNIISPSPQPHSSNSQAHRILFNQSPQKITPSASLNKYHPSPIITYNPHIGTPNQIVQIVTKGVVPQQENRINSAYDYLLRGNNHRVQGRYQEAIEDYSRAIQLDKTLTQAYNCRGNMYCQSHRYAQALIDFTAILDLDPTSAKAYNNRGWTNSRLHRHHQAVKDYLSAVRLSPLDPLYLFNLATEYLQLGQRQEAKRYFQQGIASFEGESKKGLREKYGLVDKNIGYLGSRVKEYVKTKGQIEKLEADSKKQGRNDILERAKRLAQKNEEISIKAAAKKNEIQETPYYVPYDNEKSQQAQTDKSTKAEKQSQTGLLRYENNKIEDNEQGSMQEAIANIQRQLHQLQKQLTLKDNRLCQLQKRLQNVEESMTVIEEMVTKMDKKVFVLERVLTKIRSLDSKRLQQYYDKLYRVIIDHFLAYRLTSSQFFTSKNRAFDSVQKVLDVVCLANPMLKAVPAVGSIVLIPFQILAICRKVKTDHLNEVIADKIGKSSFKTQARITQFMGFVVEKLIENQQFNSKLLQAIKDEEQCYLNSLYERVGVVKNELFSKLYSTSNVKFSYVEELVTTHITIFTHTLYKIDASEFIAIAEDQQLFYRFILDSIASVQKQQAKDVKTKEKRHGSRLSTRTGVEKQMGRHGKPCQCAIY